jgi:hypothetical protein
VASGMVIPQRCTYSNRTEDGGWLADMAVQISSLSGIEGWAPCYPAVSQLVLIRRAGIQQMGPVSRHRCATGYT